MARVERARLSAPTVDATQLAGRGVSHAVWSAVERAAMQLGERPGALGVASAADLREQIGTLVHGVWQALGDEPITLDGVASETLRPVLDALRGAYLAQPILVQDAATAVQAMRVVRAIEDVNRAIEREQVQRLLDASAGPEALELLVEVAHDVRSPLGAILLLVETIRTGRSGALTPVQERQLGLVYGAAFNLNEMVNNVVALAREGDRLIEREPIAFSVSEILQAVREIVRPIAEEKGLELRFTPPDVDWRVGHPTAISRVLLNLVTNALRETDQGFVDVGCRTLSRTRLEFFVRDTGRGIDPALREALFRAFHVEQSGKVRFSSSGLGLTICRKLIDAMHGELTVDAAPGGGSRFAFEIELPLAERL